MKTGFSGFILKVTALALCQSTLLLSEPVLNSEGASVLDWQAAYTIEDIPRHLELAKKLFEKTPSAFHATLLMKSYSQNLQIEEALKIYEGPFKEDIIKKYPDSLKDLAWSTLEYQMSGASTEQVSFILESLYQVRDIRMAPLVIKALEHSDLRVNMQALGLVESYPLDIYRAPVLDLWQTRSNLLLKIRIFSLAAHLKWPESAQMAEQFKKTEENPTRELLVALAEYEMVKERLDLELLLSMSKGESLIPLRMAAWCLRYQTLNSKDLSELYRLIFERKDSMATLLALDTLLHFHLSKTKELAKELKAVQEYWPNSLIDRQVQWLQAVAAGPSVRLAWVKSCVEKQDSFSSTAAAWALASRFEDKAIVSYLWQNRFKLKTPLQVQTAWAIVQTSSLHSKKESQEASDVLCKWVLHGPNYWSQDSDWPGLIQLRENPPSWMSSSFVRPSGIDLRLQLLEDLSLREPEKAYSLIWALYNKEPDAYLSFLMEMSWSQGRSLASIDGKTSNTRQVRLIKALIGLDPKDKADLKREFVTSDELWKEQIMEAMLQLADQNDLEFFVKGLSEPTRLSIKSASGILIALHRGTRPQKME